MRVPERKRCRVEFKAKAESSAVRDRMDILDDDWTAWVESLGSANEFSISMGVQALTIAAFGVRVTLLHVQLERVFSRYPRREPFSDKCTAAFEFKEGVDSEVLLMLPGLKRATTEECVDMLLFHRCLAVNEVREERADEAGWQDFCGNQFSNGSRI